MKKKMKKKLSFKGGPRNILVAMLVFFACILLLSKLNDYTRHVTNINYTSFLKRVENGEVKSISVSGQDVAGIFKNGTRFETVIPYTPKNWDVLKKHDVDVSITSQSGTINFWYLLPFISLILTILIVWYMIRQARGGSSGGGGGGSNIFSMGRSKAKMFLPSSIKENFDSVAGAAEAKEELKDVVDFLKSPKKFKRLGAKITRGILLVGEPGNGKTLLAKAVAGEANCPFFSISGSDFIEVFVGVGAARVRDLFKQARRHAPSIIFIDEIDAVGRHRGSGLGGGHDEREQTLNQLLTEMDGFQTGDDSVIVMAATNRPDVLDTALLRPGRFDRRVHVPFPDLVSREQILKVHAKEIKIDPDLDLGKVARGTPGFSGADLANLVNEAALNASKKGSQKMVTMLDFEEARDKVMLGKEIKTMMRTPQELKITAYHEAGHALVNLLTPKVSDPLHKVTIVPRGRALGVTHSLPEREKYIKTKEELIASVMIALGGRAAEELIFNQKTTGAYSDFNAATHMVRSMVCDYGMSDLGTAVYSQSRGDFVYSQKTAELIDKEVQKILDKCYKNTLKMLENNKDKLDILAQELLDKETLYAGDVYKLLNIEAREDHKLV
jgi:cell division protease FtsH